MLLDNAPNQAHPGQPKAGVGRSIWDSEESKNIYQQQSKMAKPGPMGGKPKATLTHSQAQPVPVTARRQVQQVQQVPPGAPTWVEKGGPQKGGNYSYRKKADNQTRPEAGRPEVSTPHRQDTGPHSRR